MNFNHFYNLQKFILSLSFVVLLGCNAKNGQNDTTTVATGSGNKNIEVKVLGLSKYGSVLIGDYRESVVSITNYTQSVAPISFQLKEPFFVRATESPCDIGILPVGTTCNITVRFEPKDFGDFSSSLTIGNSEIQFTGKGLVGGDIQASEFNINLGKMQAGEEVLKSLFLTNTGDFTVAFPTFSFPSQDYTLLSNYCGAYIDPKQKCEIRIKILKNKIGTKTETITMTSTSKGSGTSSAPIKITSEVIPGSPSGDIPFYGITPVFYANGEQTETINTDVIRDEFGNKVLDDTIVQVKLQNLTLLEASDSFQTKDGKISFKVKSTTKKGPGFISVYSGTGYGVIPIYVRSGAPYGALTLQPYNNKMIADGVTKLGLRFNTIYDKFGNIVEDGTEIPILIVGGGTVSANNSIFFPSTNLSTFDGSSSFFVKAGTVVGNIFIQARANPIKDSNNNVVDYGAKGDFPLFYIPGEPFGSIPIVASKMGINAIEDTSYITVGPIKDITGNIVKNNTKVNLSILNGLNVSWEGSSQYTDENGKISFILSGSGNRGPIFVDATANSAKGKITIWAYKNSHLTMQGQKRDDLGVGDGDNNINSGRAYIRYFKATNDPAYFPKTNDFWDEIFDYNKISNNDGSFYNIEKINGNPISTLGGPGNILPFRTPQNSALPSLVEYSNSSPIAIPYFESSVFYPAGEKFLSAPFWSTTIPTPGTKLYGCAENTADIFGNFLYNMLMFTSSSGKYSCDYDGAIVTTNSQGDRLPEDTRTNFYWPSVGYVESPLGCSFDSAQSPVFTFNLGTYLLNSNTEKLIKIYNPNPTAINGFSYFFENGSDKNWEITNIDCGSTINVQESCYLKVKYINDVNTVSSEYTGNLNLNSNAVSANVIFSVKFISTGVPPVDSSNVIGMISLKTNCYSKLVTFGGYNYVWNDRQTETKAKETNLLSIFNNRGQLISRFDDQCSIFSTQVSCESGNGCKWYKDPEYQNSPYECVNTIDLGNFPKKGSGFSQFAPVGKMIYSFGGFDPSGDGEPNSSGLMQYDTETGKWASLSPESDLTVNPEDPSQGEPAARYLHGIVYVPQTKRLYIYGGITRNPDPKTFNNQPYIALNDMWSVDLFPNPIIEDDGTITPTPLKWKRMCDNCIPIQPNTLYQAIYRDPNNPGPGYINPPAVTYMNWNAAHKKVFINWLGKSSNYWFDPTESNISFQSVDSSSGLNFLSSSFQTFVNPRLQRMFSYYRGNPSPSLYIPPQIKIWDMDSSEKTYFLAKFNLGLGSKNWATVVSPRIKAYGSSGIDSSCGDPCPGVSAYIYNYDEDKWQLIGENSSHSSEKLKTQGEITNSWNDSDAKKLISPDGYVNIIVLPKGIPSEYNQIHIDSIYLDGTF